ncbi:uncharacterized protein [Manis javanica]|uniref:uncharacterized protein n=1 Tax=Manis javanica TaxID=9974 RepID=UPI003C6D6382
MKSEVMACQGTRRDIFRSEILRAEDRASGARDRAADLGVLVQKMDLKTGKEMNSGAAQKGCRGPPGAPRSQPPTLDGMSVPPAILVNLLE